MAGLGKLAGLKGVAHSAIAVGKDAVTLRREKLLAGLRVQLEAAKSEQQGLTLMQTRMRRVKNASGVTETVAVQRPASRWFFSDVRGKWYLQVRYGNRRLAVVDGKDTIEVGPKEGLMAVIETITEAVIAGELDKAMKDAAGPRARKAEISIKTAP